MKVFNAGFPGLAQLEVTEMALLQEVLDFILNYVILTLGGPAGVLQVILSLFGL